MQPVVLEGRALAELQWLIDALPFYVLVIDAQHRILTANQAAQQWLRRTAAQLVGQRCVEDVHGLQVPVPGCPLQEARRTLEPVEVELYDEKKRTWFASSVYPSPARTADGQRVFLHTIRDITAQKRDQQARAALQAQLIQSQKLEALARLAGGIAHDFNNLLALILNYASFVGMKLPADDPAQEDLRRIRRAGKRAAELTRRLLAFGRREAGQPTVVEPRRVVGELEALMRRTLGSDVELQVDLQPDLWKVRIDPSHLEQVLLNLILNSRDAMPSGGQITIESRNLTLDRAAAASLELLAGRHVVLSVRDTGIGMSSEVMQQIFEPFFSTKERGQGSGLGLATVHGIVKQAGGAVQVSSTPGVGTCVSVYLPAVDEVPVDQLTVEETSRPAAPRVTNEQTVLVVDDDRALRSVAAEILGRGGFQVLEAEDCGSAVVCAYRYPGPIQLLLTDIVLDGLSGCELAALLRDSRPGIRVLYMSGHPEESRGVCTRARPFLEKPFTARALLEKVAEVLGGAEHGFDPQI